MKPKNIIIMKVGPHSDMSLEEIIKSKQEEELIHGVHYWGYSGVFCHPKVTQQFCLDSYQNTGENPRLILIGTKSSYDSEIGYITSYSEDSHSYKKFIGPVQLQGAQYAFVARSISIIENFSLADYLVMGGKNHGKSVPEHLRFRVNKCFATLREEKNSSDSTSITVLEAELVPPYCLWLRER